MNLKVLLFGLAWFQSKLVSFVEKSQRKNDQDLEKILGIQAKVDERKSEMKVANKVAKSIEKLYEEDDDDGVSN